MDDSMSEKFYEAQTIEVVKELSIATGGWRITTAQPDAKATAKPDVEATAQPDADFGEDVQVSGKPQPPSVEDDIETAPSGDRTVGFSSSDESERKADDMDDSMLGRIRRGILDRSVIHMKKESDDMEEEPIFGEDAYSILGTAAFFSQASAFAWFVIVLQAGMLLVTLLDLVDFNDPYSINGVVNRMQIPAGATIYVTISQFLGLLLTVMVMAAEGDLVLGASQLLKGYSSEIKEKSPHTSYAKWLFAGLFQATMGGILLLDSFILSMRSTTVIDLALNLTALHFIQEFDEKAFEIATETGLLGTKIKEECEHIQELTHFTTPKTRRRYIVWKRILIAIMTICLLVPYFVVVSWQNNGRFICKTVYIQFGDAYRPAMAHYSGLFRSQGNSFGERKDSRNYYVDESGTFQLGYCNSEEAWTISRLDGSTCDYIFKSPDTDTFDVIQVSNADWVVSTTTAGDVEVDWLKIKCNDCTTDTCKPKFGTCSEDGDQCVCKEGRFGVNCQFEEQCMWFALDQRTGGGLASIPGTAPLLSREYVSASYQRGGEVSFYDRPVYVPSNETTYEAEDDIDSFIIFTGRRWAIYSIPDERLPKLVAKYNKASNWSSTQFFDDFIRYNSKGSHEEAMEYLTSELENYFPTFFSSPVDYGEDSDGVDPSSVTWMFAKEESRNRRIISRHHDDQQQLWAKLLCSDCESGTACKNGGYCQLPDGECICPSIYDGWMCERVKDCVEAGGCNNAGTCDEVKGTCKCNKGSFGSLCHLGESKLEDEFLCSHCNLYGQGECNSTFSQECTCQEGYYGVFCNETDTP